MSSASGHSTVAVTLTSPVVVIVKSTSESKTKVLDIVILPLAVTAPDVTLVALYDAETVKVLPATI